MDKIKPVRPRWSTEGQQAVSSIWLTVANHDRSIIALDFEPRTLALANPAFKNDLSLSAISSCVAHVESYANVATMTLLGSTLHALPSDAKESLLGSLERDIENSWVKRRETLRSYCQVDLEDASLWKDWEGYVAARNAWAHGQGRLTRKQKAIGNLVEQIEAASLTLDRDVVVAQPEAVKNCAERSIRLIARIDGHVVSL